MKQTVRVLILLCLGSIVAKAQTLPMQYWRPYDQRGVNVFETPKNDTTPFTGIHVNVGGAFAQHYQAISTSNYVTNSDGSWIIPPTLTPSESGLTAADTQNHLTKLTSGFNLAMANMFLDAQVADGIRVNVTVFLSTRHHEDCWVKNGYLQMDAAKFLGIDAVNDIFKYLTVKVGDLEVDYGDQHWRRADGGNEMYNPFIENYIMDEFATEIGAEFYWHDPSGIFAMAGVTDGMLNPTVKAAAVIDSATSDTNRYNPAYHFKLGYDKQINTDLRVRLTGSFYTEGSTASSTLFGGDRAGSNYVTDMVTQAALAAASSGDANEVFTDGRYNPGFSEAVNAIMINPFIKYDGLELFGTYESVNGRKIFEKNTRSATQIAVDLIYRFGSNQQFWVGGRYNSLKAAWAPSSAANLVAIESASSAYANKDANGDPDVTINRIAISAGWFLTQSVMMKLEYVSQQFNDFPGSTNTPASKALPVNVLTDGKFNGVVVEAAVGF